MDYLTQLIGNHSQDDFLLNILFLLIGASLLALLGLCVGLVANGAADPLRQRFSRSLNDWLFRLHIRRRPQISSQGRHYRSINRS
ncbi:MAG: hypothetical protein ACR2QU_04275 [Gammaproteobacteria bacterium]